MLFIYIANIDPEFCHIDTGSYSIISLCCTSMSVSPNMTDEHNLGESETPKDTVDGSKIR